jgi:hypothetical protein
MNKKKLPRAIRPTAARTRRVGPALDTTASAHPLDSHPSEGESRATMAMETTSAEEPGKDASIVAKDAASPDATEAPRTVAVQRR